MLTSLSFHLWAALPLTGSMILILLQNEVGLRAEHGIQRGKLIGHEL